LLRAADHELRARLRAVISSGDAYTDTRKPLIDWTDPAEREALVDSRARDAYALLAVLDGQELTREVDQAARLLACVVGQDLREGQDGILRIARKVAKDRVISTVDPEARHGHKTAARGFDGYKGHVAGDPDSEIITATEVSAGNCGDAQAAVDLLADILPEQADSDVPTDSASDGQEPGREKREQESAAAYGDAAYGTGELLDRLEQAGVETMLKTQPPVNSGGRYTKDDFVVDLPEGQVTCPNGVTAPIRPAPGGGGVASFGAACATCPLAAQCTSAKTGRTVTVNRYEEQLSRARARSADPGWQADYRANRPKVERKLAHLMRRRHGGRRARVRGRTKVAADFSLLAAAVNLARLGVLGIMSTGGGGWMATPR
jgi:Transposase DDE domain